MRRLFLIVLPALAAAALLTGCSGDVSEGTDLGNGRRLFVEGEAGKPACGSCHTLEAAGTAGAAGPNLDDAFRASRDQGFEPSTFEQVVREQIAYPGIGLGMPADLVTGTGADDVAYFVATCAGNAGDSRCAPPAGGGGGGTGEEADGEAIFIQSCGSCHLLAAAGTSGAVGPSLDESAPDVALVLDRVTNGKGAMPSLAGQLTPEQIQAVADYVAASAGK
ncbi:MAG: cytochrome c [Thermoleophilia bacterium]|nr:cytochrome c [Thermoleophilia bacterium]